MKFKSGNELLIYVNNVLWVNGKEPECYIHDGVYYSEEKPVKLNVYDESTEIEFDPEKDFVACPYETSSIFIWKNEKPTAVEYIGHGNYGCDMMFQADIVGYYTICMEND